MKICLSAGWSVGWSIGPSVPILLCPRRARAWFEFLLFSFYDSYSKLNKNPDRLGGSTIVGFKKRPPDCKIYL
jgi:hypothetical protein